MSRAASRVVAASVLLLALIILAPKAHAQRTTPKPQEIFAPYWTSEAGWGTELQLKNNLSSQPLTVIPVLHLASGREIPLSPVTIAANDSASIYTNMALLEHAPDLLGQPGSYGSAVFRFNSVASLALDVTSVAMLQGAPIAIPIAARSSTINRNQKPTTLEGIWWHPRSGLNDVLVISNVSVGKAIGKLSILDASGKSWSKSLTLGPRQTARVLVNELLQQSGLSGSFGSISISFPSSSSAVDAVHFLYDESGKFSAPLEMVRRDPLATVRERTGTDAGEWTTRAPMMALSKSDPELGLSSKTVLQPVVLVHNTTARTISAKMTLNWRGDSSKGQAKLPDFQLAPFATQQVPIGAMQSLLQIPDNAHWALVSLTASAQPDDLIAMASSRDASLRYGAETNFVGGVGGHFAGGVWRADANRNAIAAITNVGTKRTDALLTLHYDGGKQKYELQQTIVPGDQMWVNLAQLIRSRVPDRKGNVLPVDLKSATYELQDLTPGLGNLNAGSLTLDNTFGFSAAPPPHGSCCGTDDANWDPNSFDLIIDGTDFGSIQGVNQCTAQPVDISVYFTSWWSGNSAVANVTTKQVHGVAIGSTNAFASGDIEEGNGGYCTIVPQQVAAPVSVGIGITSIDPDTIMIGSTNQQITIKGYGFGSSPTVNLPSAFTKTGYVASDTIIVLSGVSIGYTATIGNNNITVQGPTGTSKPAGFVVNGPNKMVVQTDQIQACIGFPYQCRIVKYTVQNFDGTLAANIPIAEGISFSGYNCTNKPDPGHAWAHCDGTHLTDGSGNFSDQWAMYNTGFTPAGCGVNITDHWQWCGPTGNNPNPGIAFGTLTGWAHTASVDINGFINPPTPMPPGQQINP